MKRTLLLAVVLALSTTPAAAHLARSRSFDGLAALSHATPTIAASVTQPITIINQAGLSLRALRSLEGALTIQSQQLAKHWNTPVVTFAPGGWPMWLVNRMPASTPAGVGGYHAYGGFTVYPWAVPPQPGIVAPGEPFVVADVCVNHPGCVTNSYGYVPGISHELIEMLVNPSVSRYVNLTPPDPTWGSSIYEEPCDYVGGVYRIGGVNVANFVYPRWFHRGSAGPWDWMHSALGALKLSAGQQQTG